MDKDAIFLILEKW